MPNLEYVPRPGTLDEKAASLPQESGYWFHGGRWHSVKPCPGDFACMPIGWSELSVKLAILGLNPPVLEQLATAVIAAKNPP